MTNQKICEALRAIAAKTSNKNEVLIPNDCEADGFTEGYHKVKDLLTFLADMLEE
jgi:hypothetical protein